MWKLIRNHIGQRILGSQESHSIRVVTSTHERVHYLIAKFYEELGEFYHANLTYKKKKTLDTKQEALYEIADVLEVIDALQEIDTSGAVKIQDFRNEILLLVTGDTPYGGYNPGEIIEAKEMKRNEKGSLNLGYLLKL